MEQTLNDFLISKLEYFDDYINNNQKEKMTHLLKPKTKNEEIITKIFMNFYKQEKQRFLSEMIGNLKSIEHILKVHSKNIFEGYEFQEIILNHKNIDNENEYWFEAEFKYLEKSDDYHNWPIITTLFIVDGSTYIKGADYELTKIVENMELYKKEDDRLRWFEEDQKKFKNIGQKNKWNNNGNVDYCDAQNLISFFNTIINNRKDYEDFKNFMFVIEDVDINK